MPIERVRAVVVDHNGGDLTRRCVDSLSATTWRGELEIVIVDNASTVPLSADAWSRTDVRVVRSEGNRGLAGGANLGMGDLSTTDAVALVNDDAVVEPGWLDHLVKALDADQGLGAASPKMRFTGSYTTVEIRSSASRHQRLDHRFVGVRLHDVRAPKRSYELVDGFGGPEIDADGRPFEWTVGCGRIDVRVDDASGTDAGLLLSAASATPVVLGEGGNEIDIVVDAVPRWFSVGLTAPAFRVVNDVGTVVNSDWYGSIAVTSSRIAVSSITPTRSSSGRVARCCFGSTTCNRWAPSTNGCTCTTRTSGSRSVVVVPVGGTCLSRKASWTTITP